MTKLQKFLQTRTITDMLILTAYKDFKKFMCYDELPNFVVNYVDSTVSPQINYNAQILPYHKPIILNVNINSIKSENFKATLVHEFTHLYDYSIISKWYTDIEMKDFMKLYSEYHASQIQILYNYKIVETVQDIVDKTKVKFEWVHLPVQRAQQYGKYIEKYCNNPSTENFYDMKVTYMYACGASSLLSTILDRPYKMATFINAYKSEMSKIKELLDSVGYKDIPEKSILDSVKTLNNKTDEIYIEKVKLNKLP